MRSSVAFLGCVFAAGTGLAACSGASSPLIGSGNDGGTASSSGGSSGGHGSSSGTASSSGGSSGSGSGGSSGSSSGGGSGSSSGSGSGGSSGGCPPCDPANVNLAGNDCDLDCSGTNKPPASCDAALTAAGPAADFAKALGVCQMATPTTWGLVSATFTQGYDSAAVPAAGQHSILPAFGSAITAREGKMLGVMSTGHAFACDDASQSTTCAAAGQGDPYFKGAQTQMTGVGTPPPGYPKGTTTCPLTAGSNSTYDVMGVTLTIKVPKNVNGMSFDFDFYSSEWPEYVCSTFNDQFVAWLQTGAWAGKGGDLNVALDTGGNAISVNTPFLNRCTPNTPTGCTGLTGTGTSTCGGGTKELEGTGFYNLGTYCTSQSTGGASTGWLTTFAPVKGGETITLQLIVWDTGDANWDSSVLVDHLQWYGAPFTVHTAPAL